jgi:hypothetical protein
MKGICMLLLFLVFTSADLAHVVMKMLIVL